MRANYTTWLCAKPIRGLSVTAPKKGGVTKQKNRSGKKIQATKMAACRESKTVKAVARCPFQSALWNLGPTCISSHVLGLPVKPCRKGTSSALLKTIGKSCRVAGPKDHIDCQKVATTY